MPIIHIVYPNEQCDNGGARVQFPLGNQSGGVLDSLNGNNYELQVYVDCSVSTGNLAYLDTRFTGCPPCLLP